MRRTLLILLSPILVIGFMVVPNSVVSSADIDAVDADSVQAAPGAEEPVFENGGPVHRDADGDIRFGSDEVVLQRSTGSALEYVVEIVDPDVGRQLVAELVSEGAVVTNTWVGAVTGFSAMLDPTTVNELRTTDGVISVAENHELTADATQMNAPWNLDRVDERDLPTDSVFSYEQTGQGVRAYVLDSGIRSTHDEFGGRVDPGYYWDFSDGTGADDCTGHGTHVAGVLGGTTYGVAKDVRLVPIKVLDCSGSTSVDIFVVGVNQIIEHHRNDPVPSVVNMSLGGPRSSAVDSAVRALVQEGLTVVTAAGNGPTDSCFQSPARVAEAITVAASDRVDGRASFSNYGPCNDLFAPGVEIVSASPESDSSTAIESGTSMSAPHVAGAVALILEQDLSASPSTVWDTIRDESTQGRVAEHSSEADRLLFVRPPESLERFAGSNRVETAIALSKHDHPDGSAAAVVVARRDLFPDALAGGPLATAAGGPVLITDPETLDPAVLDEIRRVLAPDGRVYLLGGGGSLSPGIEELLTNEGHPVVRLAGSDRYATAIAIADEIEILTGRPATEIFVAVGDNFPDALSASTAAGSAIRIGGDTAVIVLSRRGEIPPVVDSYLDGRPEAGKVFIGGPAERAADCSDAMVTCLSGTDRYQTAARVAETFFANALGIGVATGENFPDALALAPVLAERGWPLILVPSNGPVPSDAEGSIREYLEANRATITEGFLAGGTTVVSRSVSDSISELAEIAPD